MAAAGASIKWHDTTEHLEFDPERLPVAGDYVATWERPGGSGLKCTYQAHVERVKVSKSEAIELVLRYRSAEQPDATQRADARWGTSTLKWRRGAASGEAHWLDDSDPRRSGPSVLTLHPGSGPAEIHGKFWCEIWTGSRWEVWPVETALLFPEATVRCYECHGHVTLMIASKTGRAHFEHKPAHRGCSLVHNRGAAVMDRLPASAPIVQPPDDNTDISQFSSDAVEDQVIGDVGETEKMVLRRARIGQGRYRQDILDAWNRRCSVTGHGPETVLVASHIVAWKACASNRERLAVSNGLLLIPNLDKLFDRGLISFMDDGRLVLSKLLTDKDARDLGVRNGMCLRDVPAGIVPYLERHRRGGNWREPLLTLLA